MARYVLITGVDTGWSTNCHVQLRKFIGKIVEVDRFVENDGEGESYYSIKIDKSWKRVFGSTLSGTYAYRLPHCKEIDIEEYLKQSEF